MYKTGNVHLTLTNYYVDGERIPYDCYTDELVAEHFLFKIKDKNHVFHLDGDKNNNYYKKLIYIDGTEAYAIRTEGVDADVYAHRQEYIEYKYKGRQHARISYNMIYKRTYDSETKRYYPQYADATMYEPQEKDSELCMGYLEHIYYECNGENSIPLTIKLKVMQMKSSIF